MSHKILTVTLLIGLLTVTGCAFHEGHEKHMNPPTLGTELTDLQKAFDSGAITEQEYLELKDQLISSEI